MVAPITSWSGWVGEKPHGPRLSPRWHGRGTSAPSCMLLVRMHDHVLSRGVCHVRSIAHLPARRGIGTKPLGTGLPGVLQRYLWACRGGLARSAGSAPARHRVSSPVETTHRHVPRLGQRRLLIPLRAAVSSADSACRNRRPPPRDASVTHTQYPPVSLFTRAFRGNTFVLPTQFGNY